MRDKTQQIAATAIAFGAQPSVKAAALFFKHVMSCGFGGCPKELEPPFFGSYNQKWEFQAGLLEAIRLCGYESLVRHERDWWGVDETGHVFYALYHPVEGAGEDLDRALLRLVEADAAIPAGCWAADGARARSFRELTIQYNFKDARSPVFGCDLLGGTDMEVNEVLITLSNVPWIDLRHTGWEQIIEFRKDDEALQKFRSFRLFLQDSYVGKSAAYIQDDFLTKLDRFEAMRKKHGFDMQTSVIQSVIKSKYILGGGLSGVIAWLFGTIPASGIIGTAALLAGVSVEIANIGLSIRAANFNLKHEIDGSELSYVIKARDELGK